MPMIQIAFATARTSTDLEAAIAARASLLAADKLGKDPGVTAVRVERADARRWYCGGRDLAEQQTAAFWLDIRVTEGTNTKDEKAAFIAAVFAAMDELIGPLHPESYVHVVEARADSYGYGGVTQERRYIAARSPETPLP